MVAPIVVGGHSLHEYEGYRLALYERRGGRAPELEGLDVAEWMGRLLARIHLVGAERPFKHRVALDLDHMLDGPADAAIRSGLVPAHLVEHYEDSLDVIAGAIEDLWARVAPDTLRLHGDCHPGNVLWTDHGPHFVDLDDCRTGPAVQDLWMLMTGTAVQREALLKGYETFRPFDRRELQLIESLKLMRQIHHAGWIAERIDDPAFPLAFPFALEPTWWEIHINDLRSAAAQMG
ncbi:MAG: serine/threonine protein kinase [Ahniella sp.]|nr:serine/threonine protein kinase [Ahniella sp.]